MLACPYSRVSEAVKIRDLMRLSGVAFGTSGARGRADAMTDRVCFAYTDAFLRHLEDSGQLGGRRRLALAGDRRDSTPRILEAVAFAAESRGFELDPCGQIPTPALTLWGIRERIPSIMVTGSHIPEDRNGIKFNSPTGEIVKADEAAIMDYEVESSDVFDASGARTREFPALSPSGRAGDHYVRRYVEAFGPDSLEGSKIGFYGHSGVGRDLLPELLEQLGAQVVRLGYSDRFVSVDTEAIRPKDVALAAQWAQEHDVDAIVTTDGDADRPLVSDEQGHWIRGDVAGILCARHVGAKVVVTPVSSNTGVEASQWFERVIRTRIGSPYVIAAMNEALEAGAGEVVGYEANGGFLVASSLLLNGRPLEPLPTRDAAIVIVALLSESRRAGRPLSALRRELPPRYTASDRLENFPTADSRERIEAMRKAGPLAMNQAFGGISGKVLSVDVTDGLRMRFDSEEIIHLRPSGNAPELRCYVEAATDGRSRTVLAEALQVLETWRE
jgi:phosphomannomutase